ncbi:hypothetical protein P4311_07595 [Bacillus thuringiensis]|nr:hypothetical protein [Bacillus thuringiensis]MRB59404.1 hypothetical protein [Bacillus thuringiensis]
MSGLLHLASVHTPVGLPFDLFKNCYIYNQVVTYTNGICNQALLLKSEITNTPYFILVGTSPESKKVFGIDKKIAIKSLELIKNRLDNSNEEGLDVADIKQAIKALQSIDIENLGNQEIFSNLTTNIFVILSNTDNSFSEWKLRIRVSDELELIPTEFNFVGFKGSDDYGEVIIDNVHRLNLSLLRLLNDFRIDIDSGNGYISEYLGLVDSVQKTEHSGIKLTFTSNMYHLKNSRTAVTVLRELHPFNYIDFITSHHGWQANIEGYEKINQSYTVLIPIKDLQIDTDSIGIGNVQFLPTNSRDDDVNHMIEILKDTFSGDSLAKVNIDADSPFDAYLGAKKQIEHAMNVVNHLIRQDTVFEFYAVEPSLATWSRNDFIPKPYLTSLVYIINNVTNGLLITDVQNLVEPSMLKLGQGFNERIEGLEWYEDIVTAAMDDELDSETLNAFNALKWLKRSWDASNIEDQIIFSNIAIEFLLSGEKVSALIEKPLRRKIVKAAIEEFNSNYNGNVKEQEKLARDINEKFSRSLTDAPLFVKLEYLVKRLNVPITKSDMAYLRKVRNKRNDLVHGRDTDSIDKIDLWRTNSIIGMIIAFKMKEKGEM